MNTNLRLTLTFIVVTLNTVAVTVPGIPAWAAGIIVAIVTGAAAAGIPSARATDASEATDTTKLHRRTR